ncbi:hypothetical protein [Acrocarpospora sp. B8E8]|uniref:hypothetical protein n=1 Tax=Acrocarpospora sp. B8E8 TaxID=3153572 RepID=UPI00325F2AF2
MTDADVAAVGIEPRTLTAAVAAALADLGAGLASQLPKQTLSTGDGGFFLTVAGVVPALDLAISKWASYRPGRAGSPGVSTSAILATRYGDAANLAFIEGMLATWLRTAATATATAQALCAEPPARLALVGFGPTNQWTLRYLAAVLPPREVRVAVRSAASAARAEAAPGMLPESCTVSVTTDVAAAVRGADLAVSATGARTALADLGTLAERGVAVSLDGSLTWRTGARDLVVTDRAADPTAIFTPGAWPGHGEGRRVLADLAGSAVADVALVAALLGITRGEARL